MCNLRTPARSADDPASARLMSLDALRGFDMFWIVGGATIIQRLAQASEQPWLKLETKIESW